MRVNAGYFDAWVRAMRRDDKLEPGASPDQDASEAFQARYQKLREMIHAGGFEPTVRLTFDPTNFPFESIGAASGDHLILTFGGGTVGYREHDDTLFAPPNSETRVLELTVARYENILAAPGLPLRGWSTLPLKGWLLDYARSEGCIPYPTPALADDKEPIAAPEAIHAIARPLKKLAAIRGSLTGYANKKTMDDLVHALAEATAVRVRAESPLLKLLCPPEISREHIIEAKRIEDRWRHLLDMRRRAPAKEDKALRRALEPLKTCFSDLFGEAPAGRATAEDSPFCNFAVTFLNETGCTQPSGDSFTAGAIKDALYSPKARR